MHQEAERAFELMMEFVQVPPKTRSGIFLLHGSHSEIFSKAVYCASVGLRQNVWYVLYQNNMSCYVMILK